MGFLDDMDLDDISGEAIDYTIPDGVYPMFVTGSKLIDHSKKPGIQQWQITYTVSEDVEDWKGSTVSEFFDLDPELPDNRKAWLKRRLVSLGFDDEAIAQMEPDEAIGIDVTVGVKNKKVNGTVYTNVKSVVLGHDESVEDEGY